MRSPEIEKAIEIYLFTIQGEDPSFAKAPPHMLKQVALQSIALMGDPASKTRASFTELRRLIDEDFIKENPDYLKDHAA